MPSPTQLLIIAVVVILIFGTKKLRTMGSDIGEGVKNFKEAVKTDDEEQIENKPTEVAESTEEAAADKEKS